MDVLVACEWSGVVRDAFIERGYDAMSCDLEPSDAGELHYQGDVRDVIDCGWDLMIAHPPCTYLCVAGNRWFTGNPERWKQRLDAMMFVYELMNAPIDHIAIENPVGAISTHIRKPDQYIQPYEFGHTDSKKTGLWLKNLPLLVSTDVVEPVWITAKNGDRYSQSAWCPHGSGSKGKKRSVTYAGIAKAMAEQWGDYVAQRIGHSNKNECGIEVIT